MATLMGSLMLAKPAAGLQCASSARLQSLETGAQRLRAGCLVSAPKQRRQCARSGVVLAVATSAEVSSNGSAKAVAQDGQEIPLHEQPTYGRQFFPLAAVVGQVREILAYRKSEWAFVAVFDWGLRRIAQGSGLETLSSAPRLKVLISLNWDGIILFL